MYHHVNDHLYGMQLLCFAHGNKLTWHGGDDAMHATADQIVNMVHHAPQNSELIRFGFLTKKLNLTSPIMKIS